jgi:hypothetical protein
MTMLEKILKDRAWRGSTVEEVTYPGGTVGEVTYPGFQVYKITHPSGATATVLKEPGDMDSRKWSAWARKREDERSRSAE